MLMFRPLHRTTARITLAAICNGPPLFRRSQRQAMCQTSRSGPLAMNSQRNASLTTARHPWAMLGKKAVPALLIACNIVAGLCLLAHTRSVLSFIMLLSVMMVSAVAATAWYTYVDNITQPYKGVPQTMLL